MSITGATDADGGRADEGRGGHQRRRHRAVRDRLGPGRAARAGRRDGARASGSTCRCSSRRSRCWSTRRRTRSSAGRAPQRMGNAHPNLVPYETFRTADGELAVAVGSERQWPRLCEAIGLPGLAADPWYATNGDRVVHRADLRPILASRFASHTTADWAAILDRGRHPVGADQRRHGGVRDAAGRGPRDGRGGRAPRARRRAPGRPAVPAVRHARHRSAARRRCSASTPAEILAELGYGPGDVDTLRALGAI